jgi:hypothetical protein
MCAKHTLPLQLKHDLVSPACLMPGRRNAAENGYAH